MIMSEELAFKDRKELANLNGIDLLNIIEFLQLDRKEWVNQYTKAHNDYVNLQQENQQQKERIAYLERSNNRREETITSTNDELIEVEHQLDLYKSVIDKALNEIDRFIEIIKEQPSANKEDDTYTLYKLKGIKSVLKEVNNE